MVAPKPSTLGENKATAAVAGPLTGQNGDPDRRDGDGPVSTPLSGALSVGSNLLGGLALINRPDLGSNQYRNA